jgi:hypothetical protein
VTLEDSDRALILETLEQAGWIVGGPRGAAAKLGLKRTTLLAKMRRLGISRPIPQEGTDYKDGERGRNRTYNLLMERQLNQINGFSDFRAFQVGSLRQ